METFNLETGYTYDDYYTWNGDARYELYDGEPVMMVPAPSLGHQEMGGELHRQLANYLKGKSCKVFTAPVDVRLNADTGDNTVVQPDLIVVCDMKKLDGKSCKGAPDMVVEILSPSTAKRDKLIKFNKYLQAGVREYWIADPESKTVTVHILEGGRYFAQAYGETDTVRVHVLEDCHIELKDVLDID